MIAYSSAYLKKKKIINRFVRSATCEYMGDADGRPDKKLASLYKELAIFQVGMIITGYAYVLENGKSNAGQTGIYSDELIPDWQEVTEAVKDTESLLILQIVHGGRQIRAKINPGPYWAPTALHDRVFKTDPIEMSIDQIDHVKKAFIEAAVRAQKAGFHGVQLHAAHGYLLSAFLSPYLNKRDDLYGGTQENRTRLVKEIIFGIKQRVAGSFIIGVKINGEDGIEGGISIEEVIESLKILKYAGLDFVEVSGGIAEVRNSTVKNKIETGINEGYFRVHSGEIRRDLGLPIISVGGYRSLSFIEETLQSGDADFISLCRPFIREPDLIDKFKNGQKSVQCISCSRCLNPRGLDCWQLK